MIQRTYFVIIALLAWAYGSCSLAQEVRVYTTIRDLSGPPAPSRSDSSRVVVRSLMLFHAGKVYDYIEPAGEVTIFELAHRRFTVLNPRRQLSTELTQDEIRQFLGLAEDEAQKRMAALAEEASASSLKAQQVLWFQFHPDFETRFEPDKLQLSLTAEHYQYNVEGFKPTSPELVEQYLHVADWIAQFNSVLHPQSLFPAPRMRLNQELRARELLPLSIDLRAETEPVLHLQARHEWTWKFQKTDRQLIADWDKLLRDPNLRKVPFRQFQQEMLRTELARKR
ncbi:hypothetical protein [Schlesneria sp.]|uniref:hypothetical protein n=1 Tax=Schlesneria sp. TaxID=2762018 RepID=UPI002F1ED1D9